MSKIFIFVMVAISAFAFQPVFAVNWYVSPDGNDANSGTNWSAARKTIQSAVDAATNNGDIVWATNGVYDAGGRYKTPLTNRVYMTNAIILQSVNGPAESFIVGYNKTRCVYMTNGAQLIGFTLTNGSAVPSSHGGGVILYTNCMVSNCVIIGNEAGVNGGGAYLQGGTLNNCTLSGNSAATDFGGGAYGGTLNNCIIFDNLACYGGGAGYSALNNCTLSGNLATNGGGAYYSALNSCTISSNSGTNYGGGAYGGTLSNCTLSGNSSERGGGTFQATLNYCAVLNNSSVNYGGGAYYGTLNNCALSGNSADEGGGAMDATLNNCAVFCNSARLGGGVFGGTLYNCTLVSNSTVSVGGGAYLADLRNCIVYYNTIYNTTSIETGDVNSCDSKYTCASDAPAGDGNITNAPQFVNRDAGDYRLISDSPCIGAGLNSYAPTNVTPYDLDNLPRIMGAGVDMGAYEYGCVPPVVISLSTTSLSFSAAYGANPSVQSIILTNVGISPYNFTNTVSCGAGGSGWLSVSPTAGVVAAASAQICTAAVNTAGLNVGNYTATNQITSPEATNSPQDVTVSLTVSKADQAITFPAIADQVVTGIVHLAAAAGSGLPVTNFAALSGPGVVSGLTNLTFTNSGTVSVTADQAGNTNWNSAPAVTNTFSVTKVTAPVTLNNLTHIYDGNAKMVTATTVPPGLTVDITYAGNAWAPTNVGTYSVTGAVNDAFYQGTTNGTLTINSLPAPVAQAATYITSNSFVANWSAVVTATNYLVDVGVTNDFAEYMGGFSNFTAGDELSCTVTGVSMGNTYYYRVRAQNPGMTSTNSETITVSICGVPSLGGLIISNIMAHTAYLGGSITATNGYSATERGVYWGTNYGSVLADGIKYSESGEYDAGDFSFFVTNLLSGRTNYFLAYAVNSQGTNFTGESSFLTRPDAPEILPPTNITANALYANWQSAVGSTNYWLDVTGSNDFTEYLSGYSNRAAGMELTCLVTGLEARTVYYYRVRAENITGVSTDSTVMTVSAGAIVVLPVSLSYVSVYGGTNPAAQSFMVTNAGYWDFNFTNSARYSAGAAGWWGAASATGNLAGTACRTMTGMVDVTGLNAGTYYVTNAVISTEATNSPQYLMVTLTMNKGDQTITNFTPASSSSFATTNVVQLFAQASSGLAVTNFTVISGPGVVSGLTNLTFTNSGVVKVKAAQAGDTNWNIAPTVTNTFNVGMATAVVTLTNLNQTYDGTPRVVGATTAPGGLSVTITYNGSGSAPTAAGNYAVMGVVNPALYQGFANGTLTVNKADQAITFPAIPDQMTTSRVTLTVTASSGLAVSFRVESGPGAINGDILTFTGAGIVQVVASQTGNALWNAAPSLTNNIIVSDISTLAAPVNLAASDGTYTDKVAVTWSAVSGASGYQVWRAGENNVCAAVSLGNVMALSYDDNSSVVRSAIMFYYWVKAWNSMATSEFSDVDSGFCRLSESADVISGQPAVGDYDGDGKADPAVYDLASGRLFAWLSSAGYVFVMSVTTFQVAPGDLPVVGDFDGDGLADPGVFERMNGSWFIWLSSAGYSRVGPVMFGLNVNDVPVPADYDGDAKTDPAVYEAAPGGWCIWLSSAGYAKMGTFQFQQSLADIPVPGQYDGAVPASPAVYESGTGAWYVWLAGNGYGKRGPFTFNTAGNHIAVPADYDGDGKTDPATYAPALGKWRIWMSGSGYALTEMELR